MKIFEEYSLSIILFSLFFISWTFQGVFQWQSYVSEQKAHAQSIETSEFMNQFLSSTFENWQSEFLQLFSFVVLAKYFIHKGSPQSRDGDDEMKEMIQNIQKQLDKKKK